MIKGSLSFLIIVGSFLSVHAETIKLNDGLQLKLEGDGSISSVNLDGSNISSSKTGGFYFTDYQDYLKSHPLNEKEPETAGKSKKKDKKKRDKSKKEKKDKSKRGSAEFDPETLPAYLRDCIMSQIPEGMNNRDKALQLLKKKIDSIPGIQTDGAATPVPPIEKKFKGKISGKNGNINFKSIDKKAGLELDAEFKNLSDCIEVNGVLKDVTGRDRAIVLQFRLPIDTSGWDWWSQINSKKPIGEKITLTIEHRTINPPLKISFPASEYKNIRIPIPVATKGNNGLAMAIPPDSPCAFIAGVDDSALWLSLPFGLSKASKKFPSQAKFKFRIYRVSGQWGFRDAIEKYYTWYSYTYELPAKEFDFWKEDAPQWVHGGNTYRDENISPGFKEKYATLTKRYGKDYRFMAYFNLKGEVKAKKDSKPFGDKELNNENILKHIEGGRIFHQYGPEIGIPIAKNCLMMDPKGNYIAMSNGKSLSYPLNCDPDLFNDKKDAKIQADFFMGRFKWLAGRTDFTFGGVHFDTVGRWGGYLNYRKEHWAYADHPLVFDQYGQVAQYHKFCIYDLMQHLKAWALKNDFLFETAGMKTYPLGKKPRHIPGLDKDGRFFTASIASSAWHEGSYKAELFSPVNDRVFKGRKSYRIHTGSLDKGKDDQATSVA